MAGSDLSATVTSIAGGGTTYTDKRLPAAKAATPIPSRAGSGEHVTKTTGTGGGIAGPLTEAAYSERTWWAQRVTTTTDGLFSLAWTPLKSIRLIDAATNEVVMNFKEPPA